MYTSMPSEERQQPTKMIPTPMFTVCLWRETVIYNMCSMSFLALPFPYIATTPNMPEKGKLFTLNSYVLLDINSQPLGFYLVALVNALMSCHYRSFKTDTIIKNWVCDLMTVCVEFLLWSWAVRFKAVVKNVSQAKLSNLRSERGSFGEIPTKPI